MQSTDFALYLITDRHQTGQRPLKEVVQRALDGGVRSVQLREKDLSSIELYRLAELLRRVTDEFDARLLINDRLDVTLAVAADGVHIGSNSLPTATVRRILGPGKIIAYSAHSVAEALQAQADSADMVTYGPVFFTPSKAAYGAPCGVNKLAEAVSALNIPVVALGGITAATVAEAMAAGACGAAVISAVMAAADPYMAATSLLHTIKDYAQES